MANEKNENLGTPFPDNLGLGGGPGGHVGTLGGGPPSGVDPIFESYIYPYIEQEDGLGGGPGGHVGTLGGPPEDRKPLFVVYTFQFTPMKPKHPSIEEPPKPGGN